jgi:hypothetical protein
MEFPVIGFDVDVAAIAQQSITYKNKLVSSLFA